MRMTSRVLLLLAALSPNGHADITSKVKKVVERGTLNQPGTRPFHLRAAVTPSFERDKDSGRIGVVEIWWASPDQWKQEVRSPEFHQIKIMNAGREWQNYEGDYLPEWLRETALELINPVPPLKDVLENAKTAEVKRISGRTRTGQLIQQVDLGWTTTTGTTEAKNIQRSWVAFDDNADLLLYAGGFGWGGEFKDYQSFHGRNVARTINVGTPQVTAKVLLLEDLGQVPAGFFDVSAANNPQPLRTELVDEERLRANLLPTDPIIWPTLENGSLEGNVTTWIVVDREGKVREIENIVSENSGVNDVGKNAVTKMHFKPFIRDGIPVQVMSQVTIPFKTTRPIGAEAFKSAQEYFDTGRKMGFPSAGTDSPYVLHAEFELRNKAGALVTGRYVDTWISDSQWRREAWLGDSHFVRSRNNDKRYRLSEGEQAALLELVFRMMEPIPATDTFVESDWRIKRDTTNGSPAIRVLTGYESPAGDLDPIQARGYWFDDSGLLLKAHFRGVETQRADFADFGKAKIARRIDVLKDGNIVMRIHMTDIGPAGPFPESKFKLPGHEWERIFTRSHAMERQFTDEAR